MSQTAKKSQEVWSDPLLTVEEASEYLQVPVKTMYMWRYRGVGPEALRVGRYLRYRRSGVEEWLDQQGDRK